MEDLTETQATELRRLEEIATEKRIAYQKIDKELFENGNTNDPALIPQYTKAKAELIEAVHQYNIFRTSLSKGKY